MKSDNKAAIIKYLEIRHLYDGRFVGPFENNTEGFILVKHYFVMLIELDA